VGQVRKRASSAGSRRVISLDLPWRTILRLLCVAALIWCWIQLTWVFLLMIATILLAVTLDPLVRRLEDYRVPRWVASSLVVGVLASVIVGFFVLTSTQLSMQASLVQARMAEALRMLRDRVPPSWIETLGLGTPETFFESYLGLSGATFVHGLTSALVIFVLATISTFYLLIEGRTTYVWLLAFVPAQRRRRVALTAAECQRVIFGYVSGNLATSAFAAAFVLITLTWLHVPAALLLALLAGICDFVPVLGFMVSGVPAVLLALTVSGPTAISVLALYGLYHVIENYFIAPYVYGDRLQLSNVAILLAFAAGLELAGVVGALIALPIAAAYPAVERIWLGEKLGRNVIEEHAIIEGRGQVLPESPGPIWSSVAGPHTRQPL